jgi:hypothetical protein
MVNPAAGSGSPTAAWDAMDGITLEYVHAGPDALRSISESYTVTVFERAQRSAMSNPSKFLKQPLRYLRQD